MAEDLAALIVVSLVVAAEAIILALLLRPHGYEQRKDYAQILATVAAGTALFAQVVLTRRNIQVSRDIATEKADSDREGQITERYTRAIDHLGNETMAIRLGGIYALERIAKDSSKDNVTIMEVLTAYVREHCYSMSRLDTQLWRVREEMKNPTLTLEHMDAYRREESALVVTITRSNTDIRATLDVIGRRNMAYEAMTGPVPLNFSGIVIRGLFFGIHFENAGFYNSTLREVYFGFSRLERAAFRKARVENVKFVSVVLDSTDFTGALFDRVAFSDTDLRGTVGLTQWHVDQCMFFGNCILPPDLHWPGEPSPGNPDSTP